MKSECTWGDGPDVLLSLDGTQMLLHQTPGEFDHSVFGTVYQGSICLTAAEARHLAAQLLVSAQAAESFDQSYEEYCKEQP